jgi:hypothetical protein
MLRFAVAAALLTVASVSSARPAEPPPNGGCACPNGAEQLLEQIDYVFVGDLVEVKGEGDDVGTAVIRVRENFKGELSGVVEVRDAASTKCSWSVFEMAAPGRYVIFANLDEGELVTPAFCPQTQPLSGGRTSWRRSRLRPGTARRDDGGRAQPRCRRRRARSEGRLVAGSQAGAGSQACGPASDPRVT